MDTENNLNINMEQMSQKYSEVWLKDASNHYHLLLHILSFLSHHKTTAIHRQGAPSLVKTTRRNVS